MDNIWIAGIVLAFIVFSVIAHRDFKRKDYNKACFCLMIAVLIMMGGMAIAQMGLL
jgi:hypothetical protein